MKCSTVLIADDHAVVVEGLLRILDLAEFKVVGVARDGRALLKDAAFLQPDVIIVDVTMPLLNGIDAACEIHKHNRKPKIIFLTMHREVAYAAAALAAGASGYVLKSAAGDELINALHHVLNGGSYISPSIAKSVGHALEIRATESSSEIDLFTHRQREVLQLVAEGKQVKEIAALLNLSPKTVEFHKYRIMNLLNLRTVVDLTRYALKCGMIG